MSDAMVLTHLEIENVKKVKAIRISPETGQPVIQVRGNNGEGKTSVLDAIAMLFGGKGIQPTRPIRDGEDHARVLGELGDLVIERRWTSNERSTLEIKAKDGAKYGSPQALLDSLVGQLSFDPMRFMALEPKKQAEAVRQLANLDFSAMDANRERLFAQRTKANGEVDSLAKRLKAMPEALPVQRVDVADLLRQQDALLAQQKQAEEATRGVTLAKARHQQAFEEMNRAITRMDLARKAYEAAQREVDICNGTLSEKSILIQQAEAIQGRAPIVGPELDDVKERIAQASEINQQVDQAMQRVKLMEEHEQAKHHADELTTGIQRIDEVKAKLLKEATLPVAGLGFTADGVTMGGVPLEQASAAEKLRVSVAMGLALNPKIRVLLIRDGSLLDDRSMKLVAEMAHKAGAQVWLEVVGKGDVGVVIEDGEVASVNGQDKPTSKRKLRAVE